MTMLYQYRAMLAPDDEQSLKQFIAELNELGRGGWRIAAHLQRGKLAEASYLLMERERHDMLPIGSTTLAQEPASPITLKESPAARWPWLPNGDLDPKSQLSSATPERDWSATDILSGADS